MADPALEAIRVTADRVRRCRAEVEREPTDPLRMRKLGTALHDLDDLVHVARSHGVDCDEIQVAMRDSAGRFKSKPRTHR